MYSFDYGDYVLHSELVELKFINMKKEGCIKGLLHLMEKVLISHFCTDAHVQIRALLKKDIRFKDIIHQFDVFHKSMKIHSKLLECANKKGNKVLLEFIPAIRNHFRYSAQHFLDDSHKMVDMWILVLRHLVEEYMWHDGQRAHDPLPQYAPTLDIKSTAMEKI